MRILFISLNQQDVEEFKQAPTDISALGARYLSSYLKNKGHQVNILFLAKPYGKEENQSELEQINNLLDKLSPDLIGVSLMSNHYFRAKKITAFIKNKFKTPVVWGGIHPTIDPHNCLDYADLVCVGEGETALESLLDKKLDKKDVPGIWYKQDDQIVNQAPSILINKIDDIPFPDYNLAGHFISHQSKLSPLTLEIFKQYYPASNGIHRLISSRGCPYA